MKVLVPLLWIATAAQAMESPCDVIVAYEDVGRPIPVPLEADEEPLEVVELASGRLATRTNQPPTESIGLRGRLIIFDPLTGAPDLAMALPTTSGKPTYVQHLEVSPDGRYVVAARSFSRAPVQVYETEPELRPLYSIKHRWKPTDSIVDSLANLIHDAAAGDPAAQAELEVADPDGDLRNLFASDPSKVRSKLERFFSRQIEGPNRARPVAPLNVRFHPESHQLLVNLGTHIALHDSRTGREVRRIYPSPHLGPGLAYFLGGGNYVVSVTPTTLVLYDARTGRKVDEAHVPRSRVTTVSPSADRLATHPVDPSRPSSLWAVSEFQGSAVLVEQKRHAGTHLGNNRQIAFSRQGYAVATDLKVEWFSPDHTSRGVLAVGRDELVVRATPSPSGNILLTEIDSPAGSLLELRNTADFRGVRIPLPNPAPRHVLSPTDVRFSRDGGELFLTLADVPLDDPTAGSKLVVVRIDVFKALARSSAPKPKESP